MTKKGYMPKLLGLFVGAILCLCVAMGALSGVGAISASAEGETVDPNKLILETVDEFDTVGYKIEVATRENESKTIPFDDATNPYDYVMTVTDNDSYWIPRNNGLYLRNSHKAVWNITTQSGVNINYGSSYADGRFDKAISAETTDPSISTFTALRAPGIDAATIYPDTGDRADGGSSGPFKTGEAVIKATFVSSSRVGNNCSAHSNEACTCGDNPGSGEALTGKYLSILYRVVHIEDTTFAFTGAAKDLNNNKHGMWLNFAAEEVNGLVVTNKEGDSANHAERFFAGSGEFFKHIYYLGNYDLDSATAAPTAAELEGKSLYDLMSGDNVKDDGMMFQTHVREDHIELMKGTGLMTDPDSFRPEDYAAGDAFYLTTDLKMIGYDGNGNWTTASSGGAKNVLEHDQFFVFDGENWSIDQFGMGISLDKREALIETEANETITANIQKGKFATADASSVVWTSSNEAVATVSGGVVTGVATGTATITATLSEKLYATCEVSVVSATEIKEITLDKRNVTIYTGNENNTYTFTPTVTGGSQHSKAVTWTSSNTAVATVDENGKVTAVAEGSVTITATAADGTHTATATVNVLEADDDDNGGDNGDNGDNNNGGNTTTPEKPKKGCGSSVAATSAVAGALLVLGFGAVIFARRKNAENK